MENNIIKLNNGMYKAFVQNFQACAKINKRLRQYRESHSNYKFTEGDEGIFVFSETQLKFVRDVMHSFACL